MYNLTVANDHTYFVGVGGVLGHNAGCRPPDTGTWNHIFRGEISSGGKITGYHHRMLGIDRGLIKLVKVTKRGKAGNKEVYEGIVEYVQNGIAHRKTSRFMVSKNSKRRD